jgi:hypothetical protein
VFAIAVALTIALRSRFVPESFGEIGHYRADAVDVIAAQETRFAGWQLCLECHDEVAEVKSNSYHRTLSCEVCHGPASDHADDPEVSPDLPTERGAACLYCHEYLPSRPTGFPQIIERVHNPMEACVDCHEPHDPTPPEVPGACSACHAQISRMKAVSHHRTLACETCHEAAPQHRQDPRAYLAKKPTERQFCGECHAPGADSPEKIPRVDISSHGGRYLCWQCHYPHFPER